MKTTEKYGFNKPESTDFYDVEHQNENWEKLDKVLEDVGSGDVVDHLESTATDLPLSANQGRVLNEKITEQNNALTLDFSNVRSDVQDLNTFLQKALEKLYPKENYLYQKGGSLASGLTTYKYPAQTLDFTVNGIYFYCNSAQNYTGIIYDTETRDLQSYNKITVKGYGSGECALGVTNSTPQLDTVTDDCVKHQSLVGQGTEFEINLDISNIDVGYIKFLVYSQSNNIYITEISLS